MKYQVTVHEKNDEAQINEVAQIDVETDYPHTAWELGLEAMGYAPHKFNTIMDTKESNTRRVVYTSKSNYGETILHGLVKPMGEYK